MSTFSTVITETLSVPAAGGNGVATGSAVSRALRGGLVGVHLNYNAAAPASTVVTLSDAYGTIVAFAASATDKRWYPVAPACDAAGAAIAGVYVPHALTGAVTATVTACNALAEAVAVTLVALAQ